jgi:O-antigen/teichoic acid export membrane protein
LITAIKDKILLFLNKGDKRMAKAKKHIFMSLGIKGVSMMIGFVMVPLTLHYLQKEQYGIWLTLSSIIAWFRLFDVGLGSGMRNKLATAMAKDEWGEARSYVSSTYAIVSIIFGSLLLLFLIANSFIDWSVVLNTSPEMAEELKIVAILTFTFFCSKFILRLLNSIFLADQRPANRGVINLISNFLSFVVVFILSKTTEGSLIYLALTIGLVPFIVLLGANIYFYSKQYRMMRPSFKFVKPRYYKELMSLGVKFFIIEIAGLIIYSSDNIIITQIFGPAEVPAYAVAHKYFNLAVVAFAIIVLPFWSASTEAFVKKDIKWIRNANRNLLKVWVGMVGVSALMLAIAGPFYRFWVPEIEVPFQLNLLMFVYINVLGLGRVFIMFINGIGKVKLQLIVTLIGAVINIPLSYFFAVNCGLGTAGVILASTVSIAFGPFVAPIQLNKILKGTAKGIWNQ